MKITKKQFLADVLHEINALKEHATKNELAKLNLQEFNPAKIDQCIYGQMTGDCTSKRAKVLMDKSCIRVSADNTLSTYRHVSMKDVLPKINGTYTGQDWCDGSRYLKFLSALEVYIATADAKNRDIIEYLRGEREALVL